VPFWVNVVLGVGTLAGAVWQFVEYRRSRRTGVPVGAILLMIGSLFFLAAIPVLFAER
jgi:hypothetical protein